jgi:hypothetical protein
MWAFVTTSSSNPASLDIPTLVQIERRKITGEVGPELAWGLTNSNSKTWEDCMRGQTFRGQVVEDLRLTAITLHCYSLDVICWEVVFFIIKSRGTRDL